MTKQAFLILTDKTSDSLIEFYKKIYSATRQKGDTFVLYHQKEAIVPNEIENLPHFTFNDSIITKAQYIPIGFSLVPGNNHFPLLQFAKENQEYDYYWCIEDDVRFSGEWSVFFDELSFFSHSFMSSHIRSSADEPDWLWWNSLAHPYQVIPFESRIRSFNPLYRISNAALRYIYESLMNFWCGHHEVLLPTLLNHRGFDLMDFGGDGQFVLPEWRNKFYIDNTPNTYGVLTDGTMRWRPSFSDIGKSSNKLYHPVKN